MKTKYNKKPDVVNVITMGCSKNLVDSENLITQLQHSGIDAEHETQTNDPNVIIINTCGFIDRAKEESVQTILEYAEEKKEGRIDRLYVTGCLSERYKSDLERDIPEVDAYFGTMDLPAVLAKFNVNYRHELIGERVISTPQHYAYVKIAEGCNRTCSFCAIPLMRGDHKSRTIESIVAEAKHLAQRGTKELILISQELTYYGLDIYKKRALADLLDALCEVEGIEWIRLHYAYPSKFPLEIFDVMARQEKICNYLDIPLQHANDGVLKRMKRQITQDQMIELLEYGREKVPNLHIRTTMLVGFPGETDEEFEDMLRFVEEQQFERLGVFEYSHEEGTSAHALEDDIPAQHKEQRKMQLMELQSEISYDRNQQKIGSVYKVIVDRKEGDYYIGRTEYDSIEVDNEVLISAVDQYLRIGDFVQVKIVKAEEYDLYGELLN